jgi:hypothetical protein
VNLATLQNVQIGALVGREIHAENLRTGILLAGQVNGPVKTMLDTPRAILAGLSAGAAVGLVLWVGQLLSRHNER